MTHDTETTLLQLPLDEEVILDAVLFCMQNTDVIWLVVEKAKLALISANTIPY